MLVAERIIYSSGWIFISFQIDELFVSFVIQVKNLNNYGLDLLDKTLIYDPVHRISAKAILEHEYFNDFDKKLVPTV